jgi:Fic family protein
VTQYSKEFNVSYPTGRSDLKKLAQLGIVQELGMDLITYYCPAIYGVTFEDIE